MKRPHYTVTVTREDADWVAIVTDGLPKGWFGGLDFEHFEDIQPGMWEVVADLTETDPTDFDITFRYELDGDVTSLLAEFLAAELAARQATLWREGALKAVVDRLSGPLSQRAVADIVHLSHQRVHQVAKLTAPASGTNEHARALIAHINSLSDAQEAV